MYATSGSSLSSRCGRLASTTSSMPRSPGVEKRWSCMLEGEDDRFVLRDDDGMLELGGDRLVRGAQRPAILLLDHAPHTSGEERLDGKDQPLVEEATVSRVIVVQNFAGAFVQPASDAMTCQIVDDVVAALACLVLDRAPDPVQRTARLGGVKGFCQSRPGCLDQFFQAALMLRNDHRRARVGIVACAFRRDVDMNQLAFAQNILVRNSMRNDWGNADAGRARKIVGDLRSGMRALCCEQRLPDLVEFARRHPGAGMSHHRAQGCGANTPNRFEGLDIF